MRNKDSATALVSIAPAEPQPRRGDVSGYLARLAALNVARRSHRNRRTHGSASDAGPSGEHSAAWRGTLLAGLGVVAFSGSFPATAYALRGFDPYLVSVGRAAVAFVAALICLLLAGGRVLPPRAQLRSYVVIALGVVFGFPLFSGLALDAGVSTAHAAVVVGLLPAATAACAALRAGERPGARFWAACGLGAASITVFTLAQGGGRMTFADLLLALALVSAAVGYTEGGRLARETPGWRVISYALVLAAPVTIPATAVLAVTTGPRVSWESGAGFAYVGLVSMFLGFVPWYAGLARGGIARAGQTQLTQPLLTLVWAWVLLGERFGPVTVVAAGAVLACVVATQRARGSLNHVTSERRMGVSSVT